MSLQTRLAALISAIGTDIKALQPGIWRAITLPNGSVPTAMDAPSARLEGDRVRLKGMLVRSSTAAVATVDSTTGAITGGGLVGTLHSSLWPSKPRTISAGISGSTASTRMVVTTAGEIYPLAGGLTSTAQVYFDGVTFTL